MNYLPMFPTVVGQDYIRELTFEELNYINSLEKRNNFSNKGSVEQYVLDKPEMTDLKQLILQSCQNYFDNVLQAQKSCRPRITQSWVNWTEINKGHQEHHHPNSLLSGVLYIQTDDEDSVVFKKRETPVISISVTDQTPMNSNIIQHKVTKGEIIIFPSTLWHGVPERVKGKIEERISLAFNVFPEGIIGDHYNSNELIL